MTLLDKRRCVCYISLNISNAVMRISRLMLSAFRELPVGERKYAGIC